MVGRGVEWSDEKSGGKGRWGGEKRRSVER